MINTTHEKKLRFFSYDEYLSEFLNIRNDNNDEEKINITELGNDLANEDIATLRSSLENIRIPRIQK